MTDIPDRLAAALADRYGLVRPLGAGGMATVYLAEDLKHDRQVAIKVLRPELAAVIGAERFLTEIRTTANLQHPHVLPLFDSGEADGFLFYVMPFVDGETLRDRLDREKQLSVDEAVRIVVAVASALDYAHRQGVIHRDIKPANILIHDGQPVLADFGIALAVSAAGGGRMTETGLSLGTPHYMSPEQASADRELNPRSDVYSLACVLYECLAGQAPFTGGSAQSVLMQILTEEARPLTRTRKSVPANVEAAVARGLEKLPADRFATAADFAAALRDPNFRHGSAAAPEGATAPAARRQRWALAWPGVAVAAVAVGVAGWLRPQPPNDQPLLRLSVPVESPPTEVSTAIRIPLAVRDDGLGMAYVAQSEEGAYEVRYRRLDQVEETTLLTGEVGSMTFSPDGTRLLAVDGARLVVVPTAGGPPRVLDDDVSDVPLAWNDRGIYYLGSQGSLLHRPTLEAPSSVLRARDPGDPLVIEPKLLPDGRHALVVVNPAQAGVPARSGVLDLDTGELVRTLDIPPARLADGEILVWIQDGSFVFQRFDPQAMEPVGPTLSEATRPSDSESGVLTVDVARSGAAVHLLRPPLAHNLLRVRRDGSRERLPFSIPPRLGFRLSPDGGRLVYNEQSFTGPDRDVFLLDLDLGTRTRLTFGGQAGYPDFDLTGSRVVYNRVTDGDYAVVAKNADGSGDESVLLDAPAEEIEVLFVPGSDDLLVRQGDRSALAGESDIWLYPAGDPDAGRPIAAGPGNQVSAAVSPDGRFVAYGSDETGTQQIFVRSLANPSARWQVSTSGGQEPVWAPDGTELYYRNGGFLWSAPVDLTDSFRQTGAANRLFNVDGTLANINHAAYQVAPDGESFYFRDLGTPQVFITLNWVPHTRRLLDEASR